MKKILSLAVVLWAVVAQGQYKTYKIDRVGSIEISNDMELQSKNYQQKADSYLKNMGMEMGERTVFQQKNLNNFKNFDTYCRIIIQTEYGEFDRLESKKPVVSNSELIELEEFYRAETIRQLRTINIRMLEFYGVSIELINKQVALKISYLRQYPGNKPVKVDVYQFQNKDRAHIVTLSYREEDAGIWKDKLKHSIGSLKIIKQ